MYNRTDTSLLPATKYQDQSDGEKRHTCMCHTLLLIFSIIGITANSLVLYAYYKKWTRSTGIFLIWILALVDVIVAGIIMPTIVADERWIEYQRTTLFKFICKSHTLLFSSNVPFSCAIMTLIAFDRYISICCSRVARAIRKKKVKKRESCSYSKNSCSSINRLSRLNSIDENCQNFGLYMFTDSFRNSTKFTLKGTTPYIFGKIQRQRTRNATFFTTPTSQVKLEGEKTNLKYFLNKTVRKPCNRKNIQFTISRAKITLFVLFFFSVTMAIIPTYVTNLQHVWHTSNIYVTDKHLNYQWKAEINQTKAALNELSNGKKIFEIYSMENSSIIEELTYIRTGCYIHQKHYSLARLASKVRGLFFLFCGATMIFLYIRVYIFIWQIRKNCLSTYSKGRETNRNMKSKNNPKSKVHQQISLVIDNRNDENDKSKDITPIHNIRKVQSLPIHKNEQKPQKNKWSDYRKSSTKKLPFCRRRYNSNIHNAIVLSILTLFFVITYAPSILSNQQILNVPKNYLCYVRHLYLINHVFNPIIYGFMNESFLKRYSNTTCKAVVMKELEKHAWEIRKFLEEEEPSMQILDKNIEKNELFIKKQQSLIDIQKKINNEMKKRIEDLANVKVSMELDSLSTNPPPTKSVDVKENKLEKVNVSRTVGPKRNRKVHISDDEDVDERQKFNNLIKNKTRNLLEDKILKNLNLSNNRPNTPSEEEKCEEREDLIEINELELTDNESMNETDLPTESIFYSTGDSTPIYSSSDEQTKIEEIPYCKKEETEKKSIGINTNEISMNEIANHVNLLNLQTCLKSKRLPMNNNNNMRSKLNLPKYGNRLENENKYIDRRLNMLRKQLNEIDKETYAETMLLIKQFEKRRNNNLTQIENKKKFN
ncbi:hypothetical protein SNEBB_005467 [Seison nebaliae]|nr:hypothetical protein SNEBB_005467 [Seison nebaliae]